MKLFLFPILSFFVLSSAFAKELTCRITHYQAENESYIVLKDVKTIKLVEQVGPTALEEYSLCRTEKEKHIAIYAVNARTKALTQINDCENNLGATDLKKFPLFMTTSNDHDAPEKTLTLVKASSGHYVGSLIVKSDSMEIATLKCK
jgi:hypothetical protein